MENVENTGEIGEIDLLKFISDTGKALAGHKASLELFNQLMAAQLATAKNHAECIAINRQAIEGLTALVNMQTRAFNVMREVVVKLFEDRYGSEGVTLPEGLVN